MRLHTALVPLLATLGLSTLGGATLLSACSSSSGGAATSPGSDASTDVTAHDAPPGNDGQADTGSTTIPDAGAEAALPVPVFIARLSASQGQLTEGLWEVAPAAAHGVGTTGTPIVSYVPLAQVTAIAVDGGTSTFGTLGTGAAQTTYTLGLTSDATGNIYAGVAAAGPAPNNPTPGIYKLPAGGGAGTLFSDGTAVTPPMVFANGLDFVGDNLFVADSNGAVYEVDATGKASVWSNDASLAADKTACGGGVPIALGANGIAHDASHVYVTNSNFGRLVSFPIQADGSAGTPVVIKEDCASLLGADGLILDPDDGSFLVALNVKDSVVRVTPAGTVTVLASGGLLANPASLLLDTAGGQRRLLISTSAFFTAADAGAPGLLAMPLP